MGTSAEIKQRASALAEKTDVNSITPKEVGGIMYDLASHGENVLRNGGTLGIRKVYESVAAMEADSTNPKDFWGDPIKKGNLVVIYDGTTTGVDNNKIYAFMKPGWELATKLDAAYATKAETDAKLAELGQAISISFDDSDRYINTDGSFSPIGAKAWWITGYVAISPNSRIKVKAFTQSGVICVAFYNQRKGYISGIQSSSSSRVWENIDIIAPSDAYYVVACTYKSVDLSINGEMLAIYPSIGSNALIGLTENFVEGVEFDNDGYIDESGVLHETISWKSTDYIKVQGGQKVIGSVFASVGATALIAMYDRYYNFLQSVTPTKEGMNSFNIIIHKEVYFVRLTTKANTNAFANFTAPIFKEDNDILKYGHSLNKPYNFNGKRAVFFGDSVTYGVASQGETIVGITDCYRKVFCDKAGLTGINKAISGSYLYCPDYDGSTPNEDSILSQVRKAITAETAADFDFVIVAGGINDFWTGKNLGTIEDEGNISVYGALKSICEHLKDNIPNAKVIFLTPINYSKFQKATPYLPLSHYRNAIFEVATMNGYSVVDMSVIGFPNNPNDTPYKAAMITDGVHPTALGHRMMGENLYSILC